MHHNLKNKENITFVFVLLCSAALSKKRARMLLFSRKKLLTTVSRFFCMQLRAYQAYYPSFIARIDLKMADDWRKQHHDLFESLLYRGFYLISLFNSNLWGKISVHFCILWASLLKLMVHNETANWKDQSRSFRLFFYRKLLRTKNKLNLRVTHYSV